MFLLLIGGSILTVGDVLMKQWVSTSDRLLYVLGMAAYMLGMVFLAESFKTKNIAAASIIFIVFNVITLALVSWCIYDESLSKIQLMGIVLAILAVVLIET